MLKSIFSVLRSWRRNARDRSIPPDPFVGMSLRDLADLPVWHPRRDEPPAR